MTNNLQENINNLRNRRYPFTTNPYSQEGKWGYKDVFGNIVIPPIFDGLGCIPRGDITIFQVCQNECNFVDSDFHEGLATFKRGFPIHKKELKLTDKEEFEYQMGLRSLEEINLEHFGPEREPFKYGYLGLNAEIKINADYWGAFRFNEGLAAVISTENEKFGFIDTSGEMKIPYKYDTASDFNMGLAYVTVNGKGGFINKEGEVAIPFDFEGNGYGEIFNHYGLILVHKNGIQVVINTKGEIIFTGKSPFDGYFYSLSGHFLFYSQRTSYSPYTNTTICHGVIDLLNLKDYPLPPSYWKEGFSDDIIILGKNEPYDKFDSYDVHIKAYFDLEGKQLTPFKYNFAFGFHDGLACVALSNGKCNTSEIPDYGDKLEKLIWDFNINVEPSIFPFQSFWSLGHYKFTFGYINHSGEEIIPCIYKLACDFHEGLAAVFDGDKWGYIDTKGQIQIPLQFDWAENFKDEFARVLKDGRFMVVDKQGNIYTSFEEIESLL